MPFLIPRADSWVKAWTKPGRALKGVGKQILFPLKLQELKVEDMAGATKLWCKHGHLRGFAYHLLTFQRNYTDPSQGKQLCTHVPSILVIEIYLLPATSQHFPQADKHWEGEGGGWMQPLPCPLWVSWDLEFIFSYVLRRKVWAGTCCASGICQCPKRRVIPWSRQSCQEGLWVLGGCGFWVLVCTICSAGGCGRACSTSRVLRFLLEVPVSPSP